MKKNKKTIIALHGGNVYPTYEDYLENIQTTTIHLERMKPRDDWKNSLETSLGADFEVLLPKMPSADNADYLLWKIWFERILNTLESPLFCVVGHSLGAMFLAKYYSENVPEKPVKAMLLVAPEYLRAESFDDEETSFNLARDISNLSASAEKVIFFHSKDDTVVLFENQEKFKNTVPNAEFKTYADKGHFFEGDFPEVVEVIKDLAL